MGYTKVSDFAVQRIGCKRASLHRPLSGASTVAGGCRARYFSDDCYRGRSRRGPNHPFHTDVIFVTRNLVEQRAPPP
jgi:hypothetical protein